MSTQEPIPPSEEELRRRQMLDALTDAVYDDDVEFSTEIASSQAFLRAFEIAEYMDVKRRHAEDPVESRRWTFALRAFLTSIAGTEFPIEEVETIDKITRDLDFEAITSNPDEAAEPDHVSVEKEIAEPEDEDSGWDSDIFAIYMDRDEFNRVSALPVYKHAEKIAAGRPGVSPDLGGAIRHINDNASGTLREKMLLIINHYVYVSAENRAKGRPGVAPDLNGAHSTIEKYGFESDDDRDAKHRMKRSLDKYVNEIASRNASGRPGVAPNMARAKQIIETYASDLGRRDAMLRQLGFM